MPRRSGPALVLGGSLALLTSGLAYAQPAAPTANARHAREGFYLRLNAGLGSVRVTYGEGSTREDVPVRGVGFGLDVLAGTTAAKGLVVGGALVTTFGRDLKLRIPARLCCPAEDSRNIGGVEAAGLLLGVFVDGVPDPRGGWHVGGMLGVSGLHIAPPDQYPRRDIGAGAAMWLGYDRAVSDSWSLGGLFRFDVAMAPFTFARDPGNISTFQIANAGYPISSTPMLMVTALYH